MALGIVEVSQSLPLSIELLVQGSYKKHIEKEKGSWPWLGDTVPLGLRGSMIPLAGSQ